MYIRPEGAGKADLVLTVRRSRDTGTRSSRRAGAGAPTPVPRRRTPRAVPPSRPGVADVVQELLHLGQGEEQAVPQVGLRLRREPPPRDRTLDLLASLELRLLRPLRVRQVRQRRWGRPNSALTGG